MDDDRDDRQGSSSAPVIVREKVKRSARAKTCDGGIAPCARCKASGATCVFDKPASAVVEDAGLTRLAAIEAALSTNERRMDHVCQQMGEIHNVLYDVLSRLKHAAPPPANSMTSPAGIPYPPGSAAAHAAAAHAHAHAHAHQQVSPAALSTSSQPHHHGTPPMYLHAGAAQSASPASGLHSLPLHPVSMGISGSFPSSSSSGVLPRRASYPPPAGAAPSASGDGHSTASTGAGAPFSSGLDALASLASAGNPGSGSGASASAADLGGGEGDEDASASGSASEGRDDTEERKPARDERGEASAGAAGAAGGGLARDGATGEGRAEGAGASASAVAGTSAGAGAAGRKESRERGEPPRKRSRMSAAVTGGPAPNAGLSVNPERFDVVAKGLIGDTQARTLVLLWLRELEPFCAVLDAGYDTYESLRRRSPFLFNTVIYTALRMSERNGTPSKELLAAAEETRRFARDSVFENNPDLEVVQAMLIMACYHQEPYVLSGMSLRLALSARMETSIEQLEAHGWQATDDKARRLTAQLRTWIYAVQLENQHSRNLGRMNLIDERDLDALVAQADRALSLPFAQGSDYRHVGNLRLSAIVRKIMQETAVLADKATPFDEQVAYVSEKKQILHDWYAHYDNLIASWEPSTLAWPRKSHLRMWHDAQLTLLVSVFRNSLLDRPETATYEHTQIVLDALQHARMALQQVLGSAVYRMGTQWSGYLLRVDLSFAAVFLLKSAAAWPHLVDRDEVAKDVALLANMLSDVAGSAKYGACLRAARAQFLARTAPTPIGNVMSSAPSGVPLPHASTALAASSPTSSSLRNILVPPLPTLSTPLSTFAANHVPPYPASIPLPSSSMPPPRPSSSSPSFANSLVPASTTPNGTSPLSPSSAGAPGQAAAAPPFGAPTAALMPGEMEIDWSLAIPPSLFDDSLIMQHDWTATANWLDGM
ncbi:uncharacterized protein RHOBADRAFT_51436 [Rhodotorula graminis WP1]|uniref:Xylanolytic transcriptional activator regulatory domain-containing protein n=1 Tax=Rhodotorula graminis (strain WP1) TaxID=578459 RepID=A0A194SA56_RHOGW|nr:uncharacterized protein RHOBADRAFT_51436 [Rhodotorula graminis WP1]KPV77603.1 hypothetical protein RHOBADRAFT_51436 [Rhodotorula graminis WP1]